MTPYYQDNAVTLYHGRFEDVLPTLDIKADLIVTDPPYGETSLAWDRWPKGWPSIVHHHTPRVPGGSGNKSVRKRGLTPHTGVIGNTGYEDDGLRLVRSVMFARSMQQSAINETEKPTGLLEPLITYGCPSGGLVLDLFAGSSSTLIAAHNIGRRAIGIEMREDQCEKAARRLQQGVLDFDGVT